jgi:hypothetical protein
LVILLIRRSEIIVRGRMTREIGKKSGYRYEVSLFFEDAITSLISRLGFFIIGVVSVELRDSSI